MAVKATKQKSPQKKADKTVEETVEEPKAVSHEDLKQEIDDLLDEIDGVLEDNAEEFVKSYIQKGGQ